MYLADTHVILWMAGGDGRLGLRTRSILASDSIKFASAISILEASIKLMTGRLEVPAGLEELIDPQGFTPLPVSTAHAAAISQFPELNGHDPFDRALLAQAKSEGLRFLTADRRLLGLGYDWILDATQ